MSRDDPDPDRHPWVVPPREQYTRMTADAVDLVIKDLKRKNDSAWARTQQQLAQRSRKRKADL